MFVRSGNAGLRVAITLNEWTLLHVVLDEWDYLVLYMHERSSSRLEYNNSKLPIARYYTPLSLQASAPQDNE
jgi:hypothetical protein